MAADSQFTQVSRQIEANSRAINDTAVIIERILGRLDGQDARIKALELAPSRRRSELSFESGCISQVAYMAFGALNFLTAVTAIIIALTHK